ncbi:hypothetical protein BpHYR1_021111 [Brachionus plicatilis]|uniref:Uncharacterized protein n=1 Tax=Brachionus plicatilis TaxID=10195 RepID=A0A3M7SE93_BRAPC|nr:hypothetical protein BpHYR1_021111 [Brachionus plicatilis]
MLLRKIKHRTTDKFDLSSLSLFIKFLEKNEEVDYRSHFLDERVRLIFNFYVENSNLAKTIIN